MNTGRVGGIFLIHIFLGEIESSLSISFSNMVPFQIPVLIVIDGILRHFDIIWEKLSSP